MKLLLVGLLGLVVSSLYWGPVAAAESNVEADSTASCLHSWTDSVSPGLTTTPQTATFTSHGETGTIHCQGLVKGHQVTGPGTFGEEGLFEGTCLSGSGMAVFSFTIPTTGGQARFRIPVTFTYGLGLGSTSSEAFPGAFVVVPTAGDCLITPITEIAVVRLGILNS